VTSRLPPTEITPEPIRESIIRAEDLGVWSGRRWVFRGVDAEVPDRGLAAVVGPPGSGRSSLLLTMAGRMTPSRGRLLVCGRTLPGQRASVRDLVAVARIGGAIELEPSLRISAHLAERGVSGRGTPQRLAGFLDLLGVSVDQARLVGALSPMDSTLVAVALAMLDDPRVVVLDDVHKGLNGRAQEQLWSRLRGLTDTGRTVVASTVDAQPARVLCDTTVHLPSPGATDARV
jgi:ABC-2 type transport system ATP-binding protein